MKAYHYILATVLGMLAMSCTKEIDKPVVPEQPGDYLVISLRSDDEPQSRAAAADTLSVVPFEGETPVELGGMELVATAEDWPVEDIALTKGKIIESHADMHGDNIKGYFDLYSSGSFVKYMYNESFSWLSSGSNQCRSSNRYLFGNSQKYRFTFVWPGTVSLNDNLQTSYTVGTDVKNQKELLYSTQEVTVNNNLTSLNVLFSHALSRVNLKTTSTCPPLTINSIDLADVYYRGTFSALTGDITASTSYKTVFTLAENLSVTGEADLCSGDRSFLVMPQTVPSSGRLEVGFTYEGKQYTVTANLSGNRWEKGKIITYTLNFNKINGWIKQITIPDELTVNVNETKSITASVAPSTATLKRVTWSQTDASKASLASAGDLVTNVTGTAVGNTSVKATAADGSEVESNNCIVHVINQIKTLTVAPATATVQNGQTQQYTATVTYWSGTTKNVTSGSSWSSSSTSVGTVSSGGLATASSTNTGQTTITASYTEDGVTLTGTAVLNVENGVISTETETQYDSETRNTTLSDRSEDTGYSAWVKINNKTSETVSPAATTVSVTYGGSHTHTVYGRVQPQKRDGTRTREVRHMADGTTQYGDWSDWTWGNWYNNGNVVETQKSSETVNDSLPALSGFTTWFTSSGAVSANTGSSSRSATLTATNGTATATATLTQQADSMDHYEYQNLDVTISANPTTISADGGSSTLTYSATYQRRTIYKSGRVGSWSNMSATPTVTGSATGFSRNGTAVTVSANPNTAQRSVTYTASYTISGTSLSDSDSVTITQAGLAVTTEYELVLDGTAVTTKVGKEMAVVRSAKFYTITKVGGVETGRTYVTVNATLVSNATGIATVNNSTSKVKGIAVGNTTLYGTYTSGGHTYTSTNTIAVTVKAASDWGVEDDNDPGSGSGEDGDYNHNN